MYRCINWPQPFPTSILLQVVADLYNEIVTRVTSIEDLVLMCIVQKAKKSFRMCLFGGEIRWMENFGEKMGSKTFLSVFHWEGEEGK